MARKTITRLLVPPTCAACRSRCDVRRSVCAGCLRELDDAGPIAGPAPPGIDAISSVAGHRGAGRAILVAYKFNGLSGLGPFIASRMSEVAPVGRDTGSVIPVPAAGLRRRWRGFDPAGDLAAFLAGWIEWPLMAGSLVRIGQGRQRGKGRSSRLADPPVVEARGDPPETVLLVDDVVTTGSTLAACATILRSHGARRILAVTFTRRV